jgi:ribose transport system substrate-binding protein
VILVALVGIGLLVVPGLTRSEPTPVPTFVPSVVEVGGEGVAGDAVPTEGEILRAQARLSDDGFVAYMACTMDSEYHATQAREMGDFATAYGLDYRIYNSNVDKSRQIPLIEQARSDGAAALIVCPLDSELLAGALTSVQNADLPLVLLASDMPSYGGVLLAGDDYLMGLAAGQAAGQFIAGEMDGEANVIILDYPDLASIVERANGIEAGIREFAPDATIVGRFKGATQEFGEASVAALLEGNLEFNVIASINDNGSFGAIKALEAAGVAPDAISIFSVDADSLARQYILDEYFIRGSVDVGREQFSRTAIDAAVKLLAGGTTLPEVIRVPPGDVITREMLLEETAAEATETE